MDHRSDETLARDATAGDRAALEVLLRRYHDRVFALCRRLCGNHADALDATQEALLTLVRRLDRFDGRSAFSTWAYRVTTNACLDELRRRKRRPEPVDTTAHEGADRFRGADHAGAVVDRFDIDRALATLTPEFRAAVVLRDQLGLDYADIASVLGVPVGTVRSRIARGRRALENELRGNRRTRPQRHNLEPESRATPHERSS